MADLFIPDAVYHALIGHMAWERNGAIIGTITIHVGETCCADRSGTDLFVGLDVLLPESARERTAGQTKTAEP